MKIRSNVNAGVVAHNHNEKTVNDSADSIESKKKLNKLQLKKETVKELNSSDLKNVNGGIYPLSRHPTYCSCTE